MESYIKEIQHIENFLLRRNKLFQNLSLHISGIFYVTDENSVITYISKTASDVFGYSSEEMTGLPFVTFLVDENKQKAIDAFHHAIDSKENIESIRLEMKRKDKTTFFAELNLKTLVSDNKLIGTAGVIQDITDRVLQEKALCYKNRFFRAVNLYSLTLANIPNDELLPFIGDRLLQKLNSTVAWISFYEKETSELVIQHACSALPNDPYLNQFMRENIKNGRIHISPDFRDEMIQKQFTLSNSFKTVAIRSIPEDKIDDLVSYFNLHWFMGLSLIHENALLGTMMVAGQSSQPVPDKHDVLAFAGVTANAIKRLQAEKALSDTNERFRKLVKYSSDFVEILDAEGKELFVSGSVKSITGYSPEEVTGSNAYLNIHPDDVPLLKKLHTSLLANPQTKYKAQYRLRCKNGKWKYLEAVGSNLLDDPAIQGIIVNVRDISDRKQTELKLAESEELYRLVVENTNDMILVNQDERIVFANRKTRNLLGYDEKQIMEVPFERLFHPDDLYEHCNRSRMLENKINPPQSYTRMLNKNGKIIQTEIYSIPILWKGQFSVLSFITDITDRYAMETALKNSELKFRTYFEKSPLAITTSDSNGHILDVNPATCKLLSYSRSSLLEMNIIDLVHPDDKNTYLHVQNALITSDHAEASVRCITGVRKELWLDTLVARLGENETIGFSRDVTSQKFYVRLLGAQKELAESISQSRSLEDILELCLNLSIEISGMDCGGIYLLNPVSGTFDLKTHSGLSERFLNAVSSFGSDSKNVLLIQKKKPVYTMHQSGTIPLNKNETAEYLKALAIIPIVYQNQSIGCLNVSSHVVEECSGDVRIALETIAGEIAPAIVRQQISARLKEREENLNIFFNTVQDVFLILNTNGDIMDVNPIAESVLEYSKKELLEKNFADVFYTEDAKNVTNNLQLCRGKHSIEFTSCTTTKLGQSLTIETRLSSGFWNGREAIFAVSRDISERIRSENQRLDLERKLLQAQKLESLGLMAGGVAHDFNNVLMGILGHTELSLLKIPDTDPVKSHLRNIQKSVLYATNLTQQMMAYAGKASFVKQHIHIESVVNAIHALICSTISTNIKFKLVVEPNLPCIYADPNQIQHVFLNLIINAAEAIGEKPGLIKLKADSFQFKAEHVSEDISFKNLSNGRYVRISVSDTGCGMDTDTQKRIFEPFFTTKLTGRGLGLASVLGIVKGHDGEFHLKSRPGLGSTFEICFPVCRSKSSTVSADSIQINTGLQPKGTVLIADDDPNLREILKEMIEFLGYDAMVAPDGLTAVEQLEKHKEKVSLVILDLTMPDIGGIEAFNRMKQVSKHLKVILVSGFSKENIPPKHEIPGLIGFLTKPFSFTQLKNTLADNMSSLSNNFPD
jgi:two-component system, cell cycle sensor histidine kinase and response regulator CckA